MNPGQSASRTSEVVIPPPDDLERVFDPDLPWGTYWPEGSAARIIAICQSLPERSRLYYSLNKLLRGPVKNASPRVFDVQSLGLKLRLLTRGNYCETTALFAPGFYDRDELDWLCSRLGNDRTFVDVGGNVGLYTLVALHRCPGTRVLTIEPDPRLRERMCFNARTHALPVEPIATALSDFEGEGQLQRSRAQSGANQLAGESTGESDAPLLSVPVTTLLAVCDQADIDGIDVLKIDIEGHEKPVLDHWFEHADASRWPRAIIIEASHDHAGVVASLVGKRGYRRDGETARNVLLVRDESNDTNASFTASADAGHVASV